ncbi:MAG TPA: M36 family metallopeptidase [Pyrinomonadaceae bacterium]
MKRRTGWALLCAASLILVSLAWDFAPRVTSQGRQRGAGAGDKPQRYATFENFDIRSQDSKPAQLAQERRQAARRTKAKADTGVRGEAMELAGQRLAARVPGARVADNERTGVPEVVTATARGQFLTARSNQSPEAVVRGFLSRNAELYGLSARQAASLKKTADYANPAGNLRWVVLEQEIGGIPVFQGQLVAALTAEGELVRTVSGLAAGVDDTAGSKAGGKGANSSHALSAKPGLSAAEAVSAAAASIGMSVDPGTLAIRETSEDGSTVVFHPGPFADEVKAELRFFQETPGEITLAWSMVLWQDMPAYYTLVDAEDGELLWRKNLLNEQTQPATYVAYGSDSPAPLSPNLNLLTPTVPTAQGAAVGRDTFTLISEHPLGDPWLNDGDNTTTGNNVDSGMDLVAPDGIDAGSRPVGAPLRVFDFPYNPAPGIPPPGDAPTLANYRFGEAVNMFFWTNRYHDRLYALGFTEAARNFQQNNFGRGGLGNDRVLAQGQDFSGTNNANFLTPPDGTSGRMQMYIFTGPTPDRTSGLDQEILIHELTHGTSNRLHANAAGLATTMSGGMGEGWSDFYARALLSTADEDINGLYAAGGYSTQLIVAGFQSNYYYGIRRFPYALKSTVGLNGRPHNPLTFADIDPTQINLTDGAFPRGPIGSATAFQVHNIGEVWCSNLLEVRARLINRLGHAVGNQKALQFVTDGMKLDPASPTLVQGRDSILAAACAQSDVAAASADEQDIWAGFATRGLGFGASAVSSSSSSVVESFETPSVALGAVTVTDDSCDMSGFADPGETVTLNVPLTNPFCATTLTGVMASITGGGSASYGDLAPGAGATQPLTYTVPSGAACGSTIDVPIEITSSLGTATKIFKLQVGAPTSLGTPVSAGTGNVVVPLPDVAVTEIPITVTDTGFVGDVNVSFRLNHTFDGDLAISLIAPDGSSVPLSNNRGGAGDNFGTGANDCSGTQTVFDDSAANPVSAGVAPFNGTFRPESPLAAFNGKEMNGVWKLRIADTGALDVGTLGCASLQVTPQLYFCCGTPGTPIIDAAPPATVVAESVSPANNAPDPDETVTMSFPLKNVGTGLTTNLVATLLPGGGVNTPSGPQTYGVLSPVGPAVARNFTFVPSGACGSDITATFQLQDGPLNLGTVTFTIRLGSTTVGGAAGANPANILIPATGTGAATGSPANPYPSNISIAGVTGMVSKVTATITGFSHTFPGDVDILLVGPGGQKIILMSDVGGGTDAVNTTITFDDAGPAIGATVVSGTFRPTNSGTGDVFPAPAPAAPYGSALSAFNGISPNGTWSLYVVDDAGIDAGSISGGWSLNIVTADPFCAFSACVLGVSDITQPNDPGLCGAVVNYAATVTGSCGVISYAPPSGSFFPVGTTPVVVTGTRQDSSTTTANFNVTVNDTEGPTITNASASPSVIQPSVNHKMVNVNVNYDVGDNCTAPGAIIKSLSVTSNEPINGTGDGDTAPDWEIVNANRVRLRAERAGTGTGRIYTITITATDSFGNTTTQTVLVRVPRDQS